MTKRSGHYQKSNMEFKNREIYNIYYYRFRKFYDKNYGDSKKLEEIFTQFLLSEDLGIICLSWAQDTYKVIDEKKWALSKIKYGI